MFYFNIVDLIRKKGDVWPNPLAGYNISWIFFRFSNIYNSVIPVCDMLGHGNMLRFMINILLPALFNPMYANCLRAIFFFSKEPQVGPSFCP